MPPTPTVALLLSLVVTSAVTRTAHGQDVPRGVIVETVENGSAPHAAGLRPGDRVLAWERDGTGGRLDSPFDWFKLESEDAPAGRVRLILDREGARQSVDVPDGGWGVRVRPDLEEARLTDYVQAQRLIAEGRMEDAARLLESLAAPGDAPGRRCFFLLRSGETWAAAGALEAACRAYESALDAAREPAARAAAWDGLGSCHESLSAFEKAEESFRASLRVRSEAWGLGLAAAKSLVDLGRLAEERDQLDRAARHFDEALAIQQARAPGSLALSASVNELAIVAARRGDLDGADKGFRAALAIQQRLAPDSVATAKSLNNVGIVAFQRGQWEVAEEYYRRALAIYERHGPDSVALAGTLSNLGLVARERGDPDQAEEYFRRALAIEEKRAPGGLEVASSLRNLGNVALERGELDAAGRHYREALSLEEALAPGSRSVAASLHNLGDVALDRGRPGEARGYFERALAIWADVAPGSVEAASSLSDLAAAKLRLGDLDGARNGYEAALRIQERRAPGSAALALTLDGLGRVDERQGRTEAAVRNYENALAALEAQADRAGGSTESRAGFRARYARLYRDALELLLRLNRPAEAFHVLERSRARTLLDMMAERDLDSAGDVPEDLRDARRRLATRYDEVQQRLAGLEPEKEQEALEAALAALRRLREENDRLTEAVRRRSPRFAQLRYPQPLDLEGVRHSLDAGTVLVAYSVGEERTDLFVIGPSGDLRVETIAVGEDALRREVELFRSLIRDGRAPASRRGAALEAVARRLFRLLVSPAAEVVSRGDRLLLVPDGPLQALPFAALLGDDASGAARYLVEWKPLHTAPSATVYAELRRQPVTAPEGPGPMLVAFGDPLYPGRPAAGVDPLRDPPLRSLVRQGFGFEPLPASRAEVEGIGKLYPGRAQLHLGADATEEKAKAVGRDARYVHFATHGLLDERFPLNSALVLSIPATPAAGRDNGLLQAWEVLAEVRLAADLVVLSACESALGKELRGEGLIGLTRAFHYAGARSVLGSLWQVADETTADLMVRFYTNVREGRSKDEALRAAQIELLRRASSPGRGGKHKASAPHYWAAFQLSGDWR